MNLKVLTTKKQIREYINKHNNEFIDKLITIGDFFKKAIVVDSKKFIDEDLKKLYLYKAIEGVDISKIGLSNNFLDFFKNSDLVFGFLNEIYLEKVDLQTIKSFDVYQEYEEHIEILEQIYKNYKALLHKDNLVDNITIEQYRINKNFFKDIQKIEFEVLGYLSKFEREILSNIEIPIEVSFRVNRFNRPLIEKMFGKFKDGEYVIDFHSKKVLSYKKLNENIDLTVTSFSKRINQVNFVFAKIDEFVKSGIEPEKIGVILPDESFSEYLMLFNEDVGNLNFSMGESFENSNIFILLKAIYDYKIEKDEISYIKCKDFLDEYEKCEIFDFIEKYINEKEKQVAQEELFKIKKIFSFIKGYSKEDILKFILDRLSKLTFDDVKGGRVTVMGVLESRGADLDGVIVLDFNDSFVPNVNEKDFFLNTFIRKNSNLPTQLEKESLQKNYYYNLFINAKKVEISYVKDEENDASRFLYELKLSDGEIKDEYYQNVLYSFSKKSPYIYDEKFEIPKILYPTILDTLLECPRKYYFKYVLNIENRIIEEDFFGKRFHAVMQSLKNVRFKNYKEYYDYVIKNLLKGVSKREEFNIKTNWDDKIFQFCKEDFDLILEDMEIEKELVKPKDNFTLKARADRIVANKVIDFKTSKKSVNFDESTQAEFYKYLLPECDIYFWDIYNVKLQKATPDLKNLDEKLKNIQNFSKKTENDKNCMYCEFNFYCNL